MVLYSCITVREIYTIGKILSVVGAFHCYILFTIPISIANKTLLLCHIISSISIVDILPWLDEYSVLNRMCYPCEDLRLKSTLAVSHQSPWFPFANTEHNHGIVLTIVCIILWYRWPFMDSSFWWTINISKSIFGSFKNGILICYDR